MEGCNKRQCVRSDPVRDAILNCLHESFGGVTVLCDIVLDYKACFICTPQNTDRIYKLRILRA